MNNTPAWIVNLYFFAYKYYQKFHHFLIPVFRKKSNNKVFCVGFWKTGTTSIYKAFNILGYRAGRLIHEGKEPKKGWIHYIKKCNYDAFTDDPMSFIYKDLDKTFPDSKFILTERNTQSFVKSYINYFKGTEFEKTADEIDEVIEKYESYYKEVKDYFKDRADQLLVIDVIGGEGWEKLCPFLNKPTPKKPFPHKNKGRYKK
ncbi:hypothetical protein B6U98_05755 [Thermoplasmatales archaeon ex4572_165]|nr:MAG: hypothetical protein B6U98_05755 [Thermoplasmatales archaeon ex4572_165]RLF60072.1 MAG: hypothetical protein DRN27_00585 [Thermoplasmata archaeon]